jgi:hypothetical protein
MKTTTMAIMRAALVSTCLVQVYYQLTDTSMSSNTQEHGIMDGSRIIMLCTVIGEARVFTPQPLPRLLCKHAVAMYMANVGLGEVMSLQGSHLVSYLSVLYDGIGQIKNDILHTVDAQLSKGSSKGCVDLLAGGEGSYSAPHIDGQGAPSVVIVVIQGVKDVISWASTPKIKLSAYRVMDKHTMDRLHSKLKSAAVPHARETLNAGEGFVVPAGYVHAAYNRVFTISLNFTVLPLPEVGNMLYSAAIMHRAAHTAQVITHAQLSGKGWGLVMEMYGADVLNRAQSTRLLLEASRRNNDGIVQHLDTVESVMQDLCKWQAVLSIVDNSFILGWSAVLKRKLMISNRKAFSCME